MEIPKHIPQFDFLRGVAVLLVMLFHASHDVRSFSMARYVSFGWAGVDLFFVLSGFLITGILLETREKSGYFTNFYARRILRVWPLYFILLAVMFIAVPLIAPSWGAIALSSAKPAWPFALFVQNLAIPHAVSGPLSALWSLAIEEQFYFVWPLVIWTLPREAVQRVAIAILICSPLLRLGLRLSHAQVILYFNTFTRLDGLAAGSFLAIWLRHQEPSRIRRSSLVILPVALFVDVFFMQQTWIRYSAIAFAAASIVCLSFFVPLRNSFISYTGRISYGLYLLHLAIFGLAAKPLFRLHYARTPVLNDLTYLAIGFVLCYAAASLSWFLFESQILRAKKWFSASSHQVNARAVVSLSSNAGLDSMSTE